MTPPAVGRHGRYGYRARWTGGRRRRHRRQHRWQRRQSGHQKRGKQRRRWWRRRGLRRRGWRHRRSVVVAAAATAAAVVGAATSRTLPAALRSWPPGPRTSRQRRAVRTGDGQVTITFDPTTDSCPPPVTPTPTPTVAAAVAVQAVRTLHRLSRRASRSTAKGGALRRVVPGHVTGVFLAKSQRGRRCCL